MARWFSKRWVWAALAGATVTVSIAAGRADAEEPPKVGSVMTLNIDGKGEHQFKVIKNEKQPDGSVISELKDTKTGETLSFLTPPGNTPPAPPKGSSLPKPKDGPNDPLVAPPKATMPSAPKEKEKEKDRHPLLHRVFGSDKDQAPGMGGGGSAGAEAPESGKKRGIISRIFGPKKPSGPSMPSSPTMPSSPSTSVGKPSTAAPPPVLPLPPGGLNRAPMPGNGPTPPFPSTSNEPPRVMPGNKYTPMPPMPPTPSVAAPVTPPTPAFPTPMPLPATAPPPPVSAPIPSAPTVPSVPAPLPSVPALPTIPTPPGGTSSARPIQVVLPVGFIPPQVAFDREVQPWVVALQSMTAPTARLTAAKALADCRHRSTDGVKSVLFQAAQMDPCGEVRAACITHLCELGFFHPTFLGYIQTACQDTDPAVRDAAKEACGKMLRK